MRRRWLVLVMMAIGAALSVGEGESRVVRGSSAVVTEPVCPPDTPRLRGIVSRFLTHPRLTMPRARVHITTADTATLRVLVDSTDAVMCQRIVDGLELTDVPPVDWAFYHAGGVYFVPTARTDTSGITTRWHPFVILDSSMVILDVWSM